MGRFKIKKQDTFIDMTPMSDVMVLLLTFFMLTATFVKEEPIKVSLLVRFLKSRFLQTTCSLSSLRRMVRCL